jgi:hypothetical protein
MLKEVMLTVTEVLDEESITSWKGSNSFFAALMEIPERDAVGAVSELRILKTNMN